MNKRELSEDSDSDTSDEDFVPTTKSDEVLSEVDSDGDLEDPLSDEEDTNHKHKKRPRHDVKSRKKRKQDNSDTIDEAPAQLTADEKKKKDEDVWADFMRDTGFQTKKERSENISSSTVKSVLKAENNSGAKLPQKQSDKVKITQVFNFAGEEVTVEKEVSKDSASARFLSKTEEGGTGRSRGAPKGGLSGLGGLLNQLGKKAKITTLEKSKLDWDKFKKDEKLEEELQNYNKGKDGYLERQDFLQRADLRRFEIEKDIRNVERSKRLNN